MRILITVEAPFPPLIRVEKEMRSLTAHGFDVHAVAYAAPGQPPRQHIPGLGTIHRWPFPTRLRPFRLLYGGRWPYLRFALPPIRRLADEIRPDLIQVYDLPLAWVGRQIARRLRIPLVLDFGENYPGFLVWAGKSFHPLIRAAIDYRGWDAYEALAVRWADRIVVVDPTNQERLIRLYGLPPERFAVVGNGPDLPEILPQLELAQARSRPDPAFFTLLYLGGLDYGRGVHTVIQAIPLLRQTLPQLRLLIVGDGIYRPPLQRLANDLGVSDHVRFEGWQPYSRLPEYIATADVGVVPHVKDPLTETTIPNKIFEYMLGRLPILVSDCTPLVRVASEGPCGAVFRSEDPQSCADAIAALAADPARRRDLGQRGAQAVHARYTWDKDFARLLAVYRRLEPPHKSS